MGRTVIGTEHEEVSGLLVIFLDVGVGKIH